MKFCIVGNVSIPRGTNLQEFGDADHAFVVHHPVEFQVAVVD